MKLRYDNASSRARLLKVKLFQRRHPLPFLINGNSGPESPLYRVCFEHISNAETFNGTLEERAIRVKELEDGDCPVQRMETQPRTEALLAMGLWYARFGNHLWDRNVSPEENKQSQWLHLWSISPAGCLHVHRAATPHLKASLSYLSCQSKKCDFSHKSTLHGPTEPFSTSYRNTLFL